MERGLVPFKELVVGEKIFRIPSYQRNYSWERRQLEDLWDDLTNLDLSKKHYFGTILLRKTGVKQSGLKSFDIYEIIDGQQRITTILILLKELIKQFKLLNPDAETKAEIDDLEKNYVKYKDIYKLELLGDDAAFFKTQIIDDQSYNVGTITPSQDRLKCAKDFFHEKLLDIKKSGVDYREFLTNLKKKIDNLEIIRYPVEKDSDGVLIFETVNDRGKVLSNLDKTKSFMMHMIYLSSGEIPEHLLALIDQRFANIYRQIEQLQRAQRGHFLDEDTIQRYHYIIYEPTAKGDKIMSQSYLDHLKDATRKKYKLDRQNCITYVMNYTDDLERAFITTNEIVSYGKLDEVGTMLDKLFSLERVANFFPIIEASWIRFKNKTEQLIEILRLIEVFTFRVYAIGRSRADAGEVQADRLAYKIHSKSIDVHQIFKELKNMISTYADDLTFKGDLGISEFHKRVGKRDLKYLLFEYEKNLRTNVGQSLDINLSSILTNKYDVEHIWPIDPTIVPEELQQVHEEYKNKLGNLTLTTTTWKRTWEDKPFSQKRKAYANESFACQRELSNYKDWGKDEIAQREEEIIKFALKRWKI